MLPATQCRSLPSDTVSQFRRTGMTAMTNDSGPHAQFKLKLRLNEGSQQGGPHAAWPTPRFCMAGVETVSGTARRVRRALSQHANRATENQGTAFPRRAPSKPANAGWCSRRPAGSPDDRGQEAGWSRRLMATRRPSQQAFPAGLSSCWEENAHLFTSFAVVNAHSCALLLR